MMEEDDMDFTPSPKTSSNLASLFGFTKKPLPGNASLTYTAPKPPKKESSPAKKQSEEKTKGKIIFSKAVQAYKLENRTYVNHGLIGIVISGNHESRSYGIILYRKTKEYLSQIRISRNFVITLSLNNYASFYDDNKQNWFIMFQSSGDVEQFSLKVAICKFYSSLEPPSDILIQDLGPASQQKTTPNSVVEVIYDTYTLIPEELTKLRGEISEKIKLSSYSFTNLSRGLIGCAESCKRVIIIPHSLSGHWINELGPNKDLLIEVKLEKIAIEENVPYELKFVGDGPPESPIDSSAEETSIKAKGTSIREALATTKSQKANLISRMARMGQATLPMKQSGLSAVPSDSEEEASVTSSPKPRLPKMRNAESTPSLNSSLPQTLTPEASQQLSVYQNDLSWKQAQLNKLGVAYQQLLPVSASPISSPSTDPNFSVYISESRIQAAELRMGISKISEKLDVVCNKIQSMSGGVENKSHQALVDSGGILAGIQNLITENESLRRKIEEQKEKIEQQNDRIFHLLELNHKYLEQNSTTHEKQSATESKLKIEMESLQKKEWEMESANRAALDRVKNLESDLAKSEELNKELKKRVEEFKLDAEAFKKNLEENDEKAKEFESLKDRNLKAAEAIVKLKEKLREIVSENEKLMSVIESQRGELERGCQEMKEYRSKNEEYEKMVESLKAQILEGESKTGSQIDDLSQIVARLEEENKSLMKKIDSGKENAGSMVKDDESEIKNVLPKILSVLEDQFSDSKEYSSSQVLGTIEKIFTSLIKGAFTFEEKGKSPETEAVDLKPTVLPASKTCLQKLDALTEEDEKKATLKQETNKSPLEESEKKLNDRKDTEKKSDDKKDTESLKRKDEAEDRYKSYDQSWRTAKPPPPPLFDDEDDDDDWLN